MHWCWFFLEQMKANEILSGLESLAPVDVLTTPPLPFDKELDEVLLLFDPPDLTDEEPDNATNTMQTLEEESQIYYLCHLLESFACYYCLLFLLY